MLAQLTDIRRLTIAVPLPWQQTQRRHLSLHEHYSMEMLSKYGVSVPRGEVAHTPEQARKIAEKFGECGFKSVRCGVASSPPEMLQGDRAIVSYPGLPPGRNVAVVESMAVKASPMAARLGLGANDNCSTVLYMYTAKKK